MIDLSAQARALAEEVIVHCKGRKLVMVADVKAIVESALRSAVQEALLTARSDYELLLDALPVERGWQPIETCNCSIHDELFFWIVPKTADETYRDTSGNPIVATFSGYIHRGKLRTWGGLSKATHWMPLPSPPIDPPEAR